MSRAASRASQARHATSWLAVAAAAVAGRAAFGQALPPPGLKIAFFGDQGQGGDAEAVLELVAQEGADAVLHLGDFDYDDDPAAWEAQINQVLGADYPYFAVVGNHDEDEFYGDGGYQSYIEARMKRVGVPWEGDLGAKSTHSFQGIFFVLTAPGLFGSGNSVYAPYIEDRLAEDQSAWRVSGWHVLMRKMQIGGKDDESGWGVYEESRRGGAIIATGHEHSYGRTHPLRDCSLQTVDSTENTFSIRADDPDTPQDDGVSFVFHSGLGGASIRDQERCFPADPPYGCNGEWASIYASDQGADYGALFGVFHVDGDACLARFYFKDIDGVVADEFYVRSTVGPCAGVKRQVCAPDVDDSGWVDFADMLALYQSWGPCPGPQARSEPPAEAPSCPCDFTGDGRVDLADLVALVTSWGPCPGTPDPWSILDLYIEPPPPSPLLPHNVP